VLQTRKKIRAGGMSQVVEHLPSKCKALSSNPQYYKRRKKKKKYIAVRHCNSRYKLFPMGSKLNGFVLPLKRFASDVIIGTYGYDFNMAKA
jgi:hypothetical protein